MARCAGRIACAQQSVMIGTCFRQRSLAGSSRAGGGLLLRLGPSRTVGGQERRRQRRLRSASHGIGPLWQARHTRQPPAAANSCHTCWSSDAVASHPARPASLAPVSIDLAVAPLSFERLLECVSYGLHIRRRPCGPIELSLQKVVVVVEVPRVREVHRLGLSPRGGERVAVECGDR